MNSHARDFRKSLYGFFWTHSAKNVTLLQDNRRAVVDPGLSEGLKSELSLRIEPDTPVPKTVRGLGIGRVGLACLQAFDGAS